MTRAEKKSMEAFPVSSSSTAGAFTMDDNYWPRTNFIKGYIQAEKDFMEKARFWLECNLANFSEDDRKFWIEDFIQAMICD